MKDDISWIDGKALKELREACQPKVSQEKMAEVLGVCRHKIIAIEKEKGKFQDKITVELAAQWFAYCKNRVPPRQSLQFVEKIKQLFHIT